MAVIDLPVTQITRAGIAPSFAAANADGYYVPCDGRTFIELKNTNGAVRTITVATPQTVDGLAVADRSITLPATTGDLMIGPFTADYAQAGTETALITFSAVVDVTAAGFRV